MNRITFKANQDDELLDQYLVTLLKQFIHITKHEVEPCVFDTNMRNEIIESLVEILDKYDRLPSLTDHLHDGV
jgi:Mn-dependent DtxR family transcriptional regulator